MGTKLYVEPKKLKNISSDLEKNSKEVLKLTQRMNEVKSNISSLGIDKSENLVKSLEQLSNQMNSEYKSLHKMGSSLTSVSTVYITVEKKIQTNQKGKSGVVKNNSNDKKQTTTNTKKDSTTTRKDNTKNNTPSKKDTTTTKSNTNNSNVATPNNAQIQKYIDNMDKNLTLPKEKMEAIKVMGTTLLNQGYEPAFVAGILGNIVAEGTAGRFESSNYKSHPSAEPAYLKYMDNNYNYRNVFSGKSISEVGISKTYEVLQQLEKNGYKGKFGLGTVQWTGGRTMNLIKCYQEVCGNNDYPTKEQCLQAESLLIAKELKGDYSSVYSNWKNSNCSAQSAGKIVCQQYERPKVDSSTERGKTSQTIYNAMMGK